MCVFVVDLCLILSSVLLCGIAVISNGKISILQKLYIGSLLLVLDLQTGFSYCLLDYKIHGVSNQFV